MKSQRTTLGCALAIAALLALTGCSTDSSVEAATLPTLATSAPTVAPSATTTLAATTTSAAPSTSTDTPTTVVAPTTSSTTVAAATSKTVAPTTTTIAPPETTTTVPAPTAPVPELAPPLADPLPATFRNSGRGRIGALQQRLLDLGFWVLNVDGNYDWTTQQAVMAFQKYEGIESDGIAGDETIGRMNAWTLKAVATDYVGDLVEVDKGRQLLFIIQGGVTKWVMNTSTGSNKPYTEVNQKTGKPITDTATTPEGNFAIYREYTNGWEKGELGELYRPKYVKGGVAIHGAPNVPNYPASHGCIRVSVPAMDWMWANDILPQKLAVHIHS